MSLQLSQQSKRLELQHILTLQQLNTLDIHRGNNTRTLFLQLLAHLSKLEHAETANTVTASKHLLKSNLLWPMSWIIPRLESRSIATLEMIHDSQGEYETIAAKLLAVHHFYTSLFTPRPQDQFSEEAASMLLSSI
ncbi:uncharacterized protein UBRO_20196 [Ustilago bromivora]|uniref:Uncharacterized protein n=1 Tax=Ustilago bromivora TaxID=307758 RepID=A0A1K0G7F1_9BASI|nr:uncharacterized protein UBRO_20196 [Ustilago bromivora]